MRVKFPAAICVATAFLFSNAGCDSKPNQPTQVATTEPSSRSKGKGADDGGTMPAIHFRDMTKDSAVQFIYKNSGESNQYTILESLGGGAGTFDFDVDGRIDLAFAGGGVITSDSTSGLPAGLFRNLGEFHFRDVSQPAGGGFPSPKYTHGITAADFDNDGFPDFVVTGYGGLQLWHNQGDGTFAEIHSAAGMNDELWSSSAAWGDFNGDGNLDLYVDHYVNWSFKNHPYCSSPIANQRDICPPRSFEGLPDILYMSDGDGTFQDGSARAKLRTDRGSKGLGVIAADLDLDGDTDIYVCNDTTDNFFYINDGQGIFEESGVLRGVAVDDRGVPNGSMGVDVCDFNGDNRPDIWVANYEREAFAMYRNEGKGQFLHVSQLTGVAALGGLFVGFGTVCADFDHDGDDDIAVANGHVILFPQAAPRRQQSLVLENVQKRFRRLTYPESDYFGTAHEGRGLVSVDLDNDGRVDLVFSNINEPAAILRNESSEASWLGIHIVGRKSNRDGLGAIITVVTKEGEKSKHVRGGGSYLSTLDNRLIWGWAKPPEIQSIRVTWVGGKTTEITPPTTMNQFVTVVESVD